MGAGRPGYGVSCPRSTLSFGFFLRSGSFPLRRFGMRRLISAVLAVLALVAFSASAYAQGGGASSTGTIQGRVTDAQGAVLPGVTVTATSPSALGAQTTATSETG